MRVKINGKYEETTAGNVMELLQSKGVEPRMVSVELNSTILERESYADTKIQEGDSLEFLFFMGGGAIIQ
jgi:sulfur carrier protein